MELVGFGKTGDDISLVAWFEYFGPLHWEKTFVKTLWIYFSGLVKNYYWLEACITETVFIGIIIFGEKSGLPVNLFKKLSLWLMRINYFKGTNFWERNFYFFILNSRKFNSANYLTCKQSWKLILTKLFNI